MNKEKDQTPVIIFRGNFYEVEFVRTILTDHGIESYLNDEYTGTLAPWYTSPGGAGSVKVVVASSDAEKAKELVDEYRESIK